MPIGIDRIRFFASDLQPGESAHAQVRIRRLDEHNCVSDLLLRNAEGAVHTAIQGWSTRRYQMDGGFLSVIRQASRHPASQLIPPNVALFEDRYDTAIMRDYICRRYLTESERDTYQSLSPRRRRQWLAGRVAAKDAIRDWVRRERGVAVIYPQEVIVGAEASGAPRVHANVTQTVPSGLHVSISHKGSLAVAIVAEQPVGVDLEQIAARDESFLELVFSAKERALLAGPEAAAEHTRGWVAKEVAAKAAETGLGGHLRDYVIEARDGDCFCVNGHWVVTHVVRDCIVGWSFVPAPQPAADPSPRTADRSH
jgi:phosphopantetheinyl transferase (holo-ACP synthase)